jgi:hypothetical protein
MNRILLTASSLSCILLCLCGEGLAAGAAVGADPPGVVIDRSPDFARVYVGCPSLAVLPDGSYVASHSWFGPGTPNRQTAVFASADRGQTWRHVADIDGQWWSTLFTHNGALYIMGVSKEYGHAVIRRSTDGGHTWTDPKDAKTGLLLADARYHCAPVPVDGPGGRMKTPRRTAAGRGTSAPWSCRPRPTPTCSTHQTGPPPTACTSIPIGS